MIPAFVLDCSAAMTMCFHDERVPEIDAFWKGHLAARIIVPPIWFIEVANALVVGERRARLTARHAEETISDLLRFGFEADLSHSTHLALATLPAIARATALTAYDAAYLELAMRRGVPLCSLDDALVRVAKRNGVGVVNMRTGGLE